MTEPPPDNPFSSNIDSDDSSTEEAAGLVASPEESKKTEAILSSYREYISEIREELPPDADAAVAAAAIEGGGNGGGKRAGPLEPDEETPIDPSLDPPEESVDFLPKSRFSRAKRRLAGRLPRGRFRKRENQAYEDAEDELDEMYTELGVDRPSRKYRYTHPSLHRFDKKCAIGTALVVAGAIIIGVVVGTQKKKVLDVLTSEEDKLHSMLHSADSSPVEGGSEEVVSEAQRESEAYERITEMYEPLWFDREDGWEGQSYDEGILFCATNSRILCPYEAYCPLGPDTAPLGGGQKMPQSWAPLIDSENGWVQIGQTGQCKQWKDMYTDVPSWGETGAGSEIITEHIMCCMPHSIDVQQRPGAQQGSFSSSNQDDPGASEPVTEPAADLGDTNWEQTMFEGVNTADYQPTWYSRSTGWDGTTYAEALKFCGFKESILCPFEAVCPNGPDHAPYGGEKLAPSGGIAWTPFIEKDKTNEWVGVSHTMECIKYTNVHDKPPTWGTTGGNEAETRNIACCKTNHAAVADSDGGESSGGEDATALSDVTIGIPATNAATPNPTNPPTPEPSYVTTTAEGESSGGEDATALSDVTIGIPATNAATPNPTNPPTPEPSYVTTTAETLEATAAGAASTGTTHSHEALELVYESISEFHEPVWFDRSRGWSGQSWPEASSFCLSQIDYKGKAMQLCALGVICPLPNEIPTLGARDNPTDDEEGRGAWAPFANMENGWVKVDNAQSCSVWNSLYGPSPEWGMTGDGAEAVTRNVLCCKSTSQATTPPPTTSPTEAMATQPLATPPPTSQVTEKPTNDKLVAATFEQTEEKYDPFWHDREVWKGTSYTDAIEFCANRGRVICPYEAYCPLGPGPHIFEGARPTTSTWAPLIDVPNGWVQAGSQDTCEVYNALHPHPPLWGLNGQGDEDVTQHIMCCDDGFTTVAEQAALASRSPIYTTPTALEQRALDSYHPVWFQRKHGYDGTTHEESMDFCQHIGDMELCPIEVYCPNGESGSLFYGRDAFSGEQWAPIETPDSLPDWVQIGSMDGASTCTTYSSNYGTEAPWDKNGASEEKKQHILCCQKKTYISDLSNKQSTIEEVMAQELQPVWYSESHGWNGGTHNDAVLFCSASGNRELCPSLAICPNGKGRAPMGGHNVDFVEEGEQWAPVGGMDNHWIQIGQKYENLATTCMDYRELMGVDTPDWGTTNDNADKKKYVLCCKKLDS